MLLEGNFEQKWPRLKERLNAVLAEYKDAPVHEVPASEALRYQLSPEAIQILLEAAADPDGDVLIIRTFEGLHVQAGRKPIATLQDGRSAAIWQGAVRQLLQNRLLESRGGKGELFSVTAEGYRVADELRSPGIGASQEKAGQPVTDAPAPAHGR